MPRLTHATERGRETLYTLREALFALMLEKDFDQITIKEITDRAQIDRSTFYLHCQDKRDLFLQSQRQLIADLFAHFPPDSPLEDRLRQGFEYMADHATAYRALLTHTDSAAEISMTEFLAAYMADALREGPIRIETDAVTRDLLAHALTHVVRGTARRWLELETPMPPAVMAQLVQRFLRHGLAGFQPGTPTTR